MRKHLLSTLLLLLFCNCFLTQVPVWHWAKDANSVSPETLKDVANDPTSNNIYVGGSFKGNLSATYGSAFTTASGNMDALVAKYDALGNVLWAFKIAGAAGDEEVKGVAVDPSGDVYVTGSFNGTADFDPSALTFNLTTAGGTDGFLAKYSPAGSFLWAVKFGGTNNENSYKMAADANGIYLTGAYESNPATFYSYSSAITKTTFFNDSQLNFFGAKYNSSGIVQWVVSGGSNLDDYGIKTIADATNVYFIGIYYHDASFKSATNVAGATLPDEQHNEANTFILQVTQAGALGWQTNITTNSGGKNVIGWSIAQDASNLYVSGQSDGNINFKYPTPTLTQPVSTANDLFLAKLTKAAGTFLWNTSATGNGTGDQVGRALEINSQGNIILGGQFTTGLNYSAVGGPNFTASGQDIFITGYSNAGTFLWSYKGGGSGTENFNGLATDNVGNIYLAGDHGGAPTFGTVTLGTGGSTDIYVAKLGCPAVSNNTISSAQTICSGNAPSTLAGSLPVNATLYTWEMSANSSTWTSATGTFTNQNYSPPPLTTTTYYRRIATGAGCLGSPGNTLQITVTQPPSTSNAGSNQTACVSSATLNASTPVSGTGAWSVITGTGNVTSVNSPSSQVTGLSFGSNSFVWTISNAPCASSTSTITIIRNIPPSSFAGNTQTVCSATATLAATSPTVGTGAWSVITGTGNVTSVNSPSSPVTALSTGTNTFLWTVTNGVCPTATSAVNILRDIQPTANAGITQTVCAANATLAAINPTVGTGAWSVITGTGNVTSVSSPSSQITALSTGTNTFLWTVTNGVCPTATSAVNILRDIQPTSNAGNTQTVCSASATLAAINPTVGTGIWSVITGPAIVTSVNSSSSSVTALSTGTNTFLWMVSNGVCPTATSVVNILRDIQPTANAGITQTVCSGNATLAAVNPIVGNGIWSVITGTSNVTTTNNPSSQVTGLSNGANSFLWTVSNGVCAPATSTVDILRDIAPFSNAGSSQTICSSTATLNAVTPTTGTGAWSILTGTGTITAATSPSSEVTALSIGNNSFVWTVSSGVCPVATSTVVITRDATPDVSNAGTNFTVCASTTTLNANNPLIGTGNWSVLSGAATITSTISNLSGVINLSTGLNEFVWTITNGSCPASTSTVSVLSVSPAATAFAGSDQQICSDMVTLNANNVFGYGTWIAFVGSGSINNTNNYNTNVSGLSAGNNTFIWIVAKDNCPTTSDTVIIKRDELPTNSFAGQDQSVCGSLANLSANTPIVGSGQWQLIAGNGNISNLNSSQSSVSALLSGTNTFAWTISNGVCPVSVDTVIITSDLMPSDPDAGTDKNVCGDQMILTAIAPLIGTGSWSLISGTCSFTNTTSNTIQINFPTPGASVLRWTVKNGVCPDKTDDIEITRIEPPSAADAGVDETIESSVSKLNAVAPSIGSGEWSVIEGSVDFENVNDPNTSVKSLAFGTNILRWTTYNGNCPENNDDVLIYVKPLFIPNGFSPNGDGFNDKFVITSLDYYESVKFSVFNRWGALLYSSSNYKNDWTGVNANNEQLADDTYYYLIEMPDKKSLTGFIVIKQNR